MKIKETRAEHVCKGKRARAYEHTLDMDVAIEFQSWPVYVVYILTARQVTVSMRYLCLPSSLSNVFPSCSNVSPAIPFHDPADPMRKVPNGFDPISLAFKLQ